MLSAGQKVDKYRIVSLLKEGGMALVYLAEHELLKKRIALKVLPPETAKSPEMVTRFIREARAAAKLNHPHIIKIHDVGESDGLYYIAMDLVAGDTLTERIRSAGRLPESEIVRIVRQVLSALHEAHSQNLTHRDLKPQNIMIDALGNAIVMDFGIAKASQDRDLTMTGMFLGTMRYASPEQASGQPADPRSDLFSWGVVMYEMATGRVPYANPNTAEVLYQIVNDPPQPPIAIRPDLSPHLSDVIVKALAKNPQDRFASAQDMLAALDTPAPLSTMADADATRTWVAARETAVLTETVAGTVAAGRQSKEGKRWGYAAVLGTLVLVMAVVGIWWFQQLPLTENHASVRVWTDKKEYRMGERLQLRVRAEEDCYLFLYHLSADGYLQRIFPVDTEGNNFVVGGLTYTIPDDSYPFAFIAQPPAGTEKIMGLVMSQATQADLWRKTGKEIDAAKKDQLIEMATVQIVN